MTIKFNCDCGFEWEKGRSGQHNCSPFYRETIDGQQQEIAELKLAVQFQYNAAMTLDEENQIARKEIAELKAMVNALRWAADLYHGGYKVSELEEANSIMVMSPGQCLKSANADAVEDAVFNSEQIELFEDSNHIGKYVCLEDLEVNIKQLREGES